MKAVIILLIAIYSAECRKVVPINKNANLDFINMEGGGLRPAPTPAKPVNLPPSPQPKVPSSPVTTKPVAVPPKPVPAAVQPSHVSPKIQPSPVYPKVQPSIPPTNLKPVQPITTPGPGSVKQLVTFYDSQGKASVIRPYSYSDAVKKGRN